MRFSLLLVIFFTPLCRALTSRFSGTYAIAPLNLTSSAPQYAFNILAFQQGVDAGGIMDVDISVTPLNAVNILVIYSYQQIVNVIQTTSFKSTIFPSTARYEFAGNASITVQIPARNRYYVVLMTPPNVGIFSFQGTSSFTNPSPYSADVCKTTQLAVEDYYIPTVTYTSLAIYAGLSCLWAWWLRSARRRKYPIRSTWLYKHLSVCLCAQTTNALISSVYYGTYEAQGTLLTQLSDAQSFIAVFANATFLALLMTVAMGYTVSRTELTYRERQLLALAFVSLLLFSGLYAACSNNSTSNTDICMTVFLGEQVTKFLITFSVILQLHTQIEAVRAATLALHATSKPGLKTLRLTHQKVGTLTGLRKIIVVYLALPVALLFTTFSGMSWVDEKWIPLAADTVAVGAVLAALEWTMRPGSRCIIDAGPLSTQDGNNEEIDPVEVRSRESDNLIITTTSLTANSELPLQRVSEPEPPGGREDDAGAETTRNEPSSPSSNSQIRAQPALV